MPPQSLPAQNPSADSAISRLTAEESSDVFLAAGSEGAGFRGPDLDCADVGVGAGVCGSAFSVGGGSEVGPGCIVAEPGCFPGENGGLLLRFLFFGLAFTVEAGFLGMFLFSEALCLGFRSRLCFCFCFALGLSLSLDFFTFGLFCSFATELLASGLSSAL